MKMFIPTHGGMIRLTEDWSFPLHHEYRNTDLAEALELEDFVSWGERDKFTSVTLPKGTILKIDRIYIRGSYREYDSITFRTVASPDGRLATRKMGGNKDGKSRRFWAKLGDVNTIEYERFFLEQSR